MTILLNVCCTVVPRTKMSTILFVVNLYTLCKSVSQMWICGTSSRFLITKHLKKICVETKIKTF
jgi:hypothetical protein